MRKKMVWVGGGVAALVAAAMLIGTAWAAGPGAGAGRGAAVGGRDVPLTVAAEFTGLTQEQLLAELQGGKTIPVLLEENGVDLTTFHQAVAEARQQAVEEAVTAGTITPEQAQVMLQRMEQQQADGQYGPWGPRAGAGTGDCDGTGPHGPQGTARGSGLRLGRVTQ